MTCLVNASKEIGQSALVLSVWMRARLCVLRFSVIFALIDLPAKTSSRVWLSRCSVACCALVYLPSRWKEFFDSTFPSVRLFTCDGSGTTVFGQVAYVLSYLIMSGHIEFTNSGHTACVSEQPCWVCAAGLGCRLHDIIVFRHRLAFQIPLTLTPLKCRETTSARLVSDISNTHHSGSIVTFY